MDIKELKKNLRTTVRAKERALDLDYRSSSNSAICKAITSLPEYINAKVVFAFIGTKKEIDTQIIVENAWASGKTLLVPLCLDEGQMDYKEIKSHDDLEPGAYGILEPKKNCKSHDISEIDFALIPCVSCSKDGKRLGQGGGYYDRFLEKYKGAKAIICREQLLCEDIPMEAFDATVIPVVTELNVYR